MVACGKVVVLPPQSLKFKLSSRPHEVPLCVIRWLGVDMLGTEPWRLLNMAKFCAYDQHGIARSAREGTVG
jgi:hypothetical protein